MRLMIRLALQEADYLKENEELLDTLIGLFYWCAIAVLVGGFL